MLRLRCFSDWFHELHLSSSHFSLITRNFVAIIHSAIFVWVLTPETHFIDRGSLNTDLLEFQEGATVVMSRFICGKLRSLRYASTDIKR